MTMKSHESVTAIRDWLVSYLKAVPGLASENYAYRSKEDFVLRHGRPYEPQSLPQIYRRGARRACFHNSRKLAVRHRIRYVEGFAVPEEVATPIHHAWCISGDDEVVDVTWSKPGKLYFGVVIPIDLVNASSCARLQKGNGVLDDWPDKWPILQKAFTPEADRRKSKK